jgi:hypothetical protein
VEPVPQALSVSKSTQTPPALHISAEVQAMPSLQAKPVSGTEAQVPFAWHWPALHAFANVEQSLGAPAPHVSALHRSGVPTVPVHASPSSHTIMLAICVQPMLGSHESVVQRLLSSQSLRGVPREHVPFWQVCPTKHVFEVQGRPLLTGMGTQFPVFGSHMPALHWSLRESQLVMLVGAQSPEALPWHFQAFSHGRSLAQLIVTPVPLVAQPLTGSQVSIVQMLLSLQFSGLMPVQVPSRHLSSCVHTLLSSQLVVFESFA